MFYENAMAQANISLAQDQFTCSICLDIMKEPVTTACGHNYCKKCIEDCWDTTGQYSCPQCRHIFVSRPALQKNSILDEIIEKFRNAELKSEDYAGPDDVPCDLCTGRKRRAVKSCINCIANYCEGHFKPHTESEALKKHKVEKEIRKIHLKLCPNHKMLTNIFCRTDQICICLQCAAFEHKAHDTVMAEAARAEKQAQVLTSRRDVKEKMQNKKKTLEEVTVMEAQVKSTAKKEVKKYEETFNLLLQSIGELRSEVISMIKEHEKTEMRKVVDVRNQLKKEIKELEMKDTELEVISQTGDDIYFLQNFQSLCAHSVSESTPIIAVKEHLLSDTLRQNLLKLNEILGKINCSEFVKTSETGKKLDDLDRNTQQDSGFASQSASPSGLTQMRPLATCLQNDQGQSTANKSRTTATSGGQNIMSRQSSKDLKDSPETDIKEPDEMFSSAYKDIEHVLQQTAGFKERMKNQIESAKREICDWPADPQTESQLLSIQGAVDYFIDYLLWSLNKHLGDVKELQKTFKEIVQVIKEESKGAFFRSWFSRFNSPSPKVIEVVGSDKIGITEESFLNELSKKLKNHNITIQKAQLNNESRNLVLAFCPVVSRTGADIGVALKKVSSNKKIILVVMHRTPNPDYIVADSSRFVDQENVVLTVDCLFHETTGLLNCNLNKESSQKVCDFISSFI